MKKILHILIVAASSMICLTAQAQDLMLSQEIFSRVNKNPAATGNTDDIDIFLHGRIQWAGVEHGPKTTVLNVTNYEDAIRSGFGLTASYDCIGKGHNTLNAKLVYSYQIDINKRHILAMGLGAGVNVGGYDHTAIGLEDDSEIAEDEALSDKERKLSPDFDLGFEFSNIYWTLGLSCTHILNKETTMFKTGRHFYLYGTSLLPLNHNFDLGPTISVMHRKKTNVIEIGSLAFFKRTIWGGVTWRTDFHNVVNPSTLIFSLGFERSKFRFGYSFDCGIGKLNQLPSNTHEIILSYGIEKKRGKRAISE